MEDKVNLYAMISIIVAMSPNMSIGYNGSLPWHLPEDLAHFKDLTIGHTIIMGRHTFESLPHGALPGRRNIVLSKNAASVLKEHSSPEHSSNNYEVYASLEEALSHCDIKKEVFIIGGAEVYAKALPLADKIYMTLVDFNPQEADIFFPNFNIMDWKEIKKEKHIGFSFVELCKKM